MKTRLKKKRVNKISLALGQHKLKKYKLIK